MKLPSDASDEVRAAFREMMEEIELLKRRDRDMKGTRLTNTGVPIEPRDYANKGYVDRAIQKAMEGVRQVAQAARSFVVSSGGGGTTPNANPVDFGYYKVDTVLAPQNYFTEVKGWTNLVYIGPVDCGFSDTPPSDREARLRLSIQNAAAAGFGIMLDMEIRSPNLPVEIILNAANPYWDKVKYVILGDELDPATFDINGEIQSLKTKLGGKGLGLRPIGATFTPNTVLTSNVGQYNFDFINIEAYTQPCNCGGCGAPTVAEEIQRIKNLITQQKAAIPATRNLTVVMQAYNRNGAWQLSDDDLAEVQRATWFQMVKGDTRVKALLMFAWYREGNGAPGCGPSHGTSALPQLQTAHQDIWRDMTGGVTVGGPKKCIDEPGNCPGSLVCCEGGLSNPCNCPRLCEGGSYADFMEAATVATVTAHPELFTGGVFNSEAAALQYRDFLVARFNTDNTSLHAAVDPADGKQVLARRVSAPEWREDYRVWNSNLTVAHQPGSYRASCWGVPLDF